MTAIKTVLDGAIKAIKPSSKEEKEKASMINEFMGRLKPLLADARAVLGGSAKKDTWLSDSYDVDIFVAFPLTKFKERSDELSDILEKQLKKKFTFDRIHGSRDYFQIREHDFVFEIIPILDIKDSKQALNITDISPLHAKWVTKNVKEPDQVRLAKAFAKANGFYGAESFIKGFSGYCIEILIVHYGNFQKFLEAAAKWGKRKIIDIEKYHKNIEIEVNRSKLISPLVLIDPVQKGRNVAAALSEENYKRLIASAKKFLKNPTPEAFIKRPVTKESILKENKKAIIIKATPKKGKEDVIGSKLLKVHEFIATRTEAFGFTLSKDDWHWDRKGAALMWYVPKVTKLPQEMEWQGPPIEMEDHVKAFKKLYKKTHTKDGHLFAKIKREHTEIIPFIESLFTSDYITEKIKGIDFE